VGGFGSAPADALFAAAWDLRRGKRFQDVFRDILNTNGDYVLVNQEGMYVRQLYKDLLNRDASGLEVASRLRAIEKGTSLSLTAGIVVRSTEYRDLIVQGYYELFLGRSSTLEERVGWVANMTAGMTREAVIKGFLQSAEFMNRAGNTTVGFI